jgi:hypothetical protein
MRALCGAIIVAGSVIGLGLTALGFGTRYHSGLDKELYLWQVDRPMLFILVFLTSTAVIGLGIAFVGLAYHHQRRHHELHRMQSSGLMSPPNA